MPAPSEHKTVHARILAYAQAIGWTFVSREQAEHRRAGLDDVASGSEPTRLIRENGGQECPRSF
jgi:type I restriction enzyme R subunit